MAMDYEELACKDNPFYGLSPSEIDRLIIYLAYVRDPVVTQKEIYSKWNVRMSKRDIPIFEATRIADQIRCEIKRKADNVLKVRNRLIAIGCVVLLLLLVVEACRIPKKVAIDRSAQIAQEAQKEAASCREELNKTIEECRVKVERVERSANDEVRKMKESCSEKVAQAERSAKEKIAETVHEADKRVNMAEETERGKYRKVLCDYVSAGLAGDSRTALLRIIDAIKSEEAIPRHQIDDDLSQLVDAARSALKNANCSAEVLFQCGDSLKNYLIRQPKTTEADRLNITDLMINCYRKSLTLGAGKAGYELFLLYGGKDYCFEGVNNLVGQKLKIVSKLVVAKNQQLAWTALENACTLGNYESLSLMLFLAQYKTSYYGIYFRKPGWNRNVYGDNDEKFLAILADHMNVTPDQLERIAKIHLGFGDKYTSYAIKIYRQASARGNVSAKNWLIANGHAFDE